MDDAPLRRGQKANHLEFGEAIAILAAFGLLNLAFGTLARTYEPTYRRASWRFSSDAVGSDGLIGGQAARSAGHRPANQLRNPRTHPPRQDRGALQRGGDGRRHRLGRIRGRGAIAVGIRQEPRARISNHRRPPGRRRQSEGHRKGHTRGRQEDDVRLVQRDRGRAPARSWSSVRPPIALWSHLASARIVFASSPHLSRAEAGNVRT